MKITIENMTITSKSNFDALMRDVKTLMSWKPSTIELKDITIENK